MMKVHKKRRKKDMINGENKKEEERIDESFSLIPS